MFKSNRSLVISTLLTGTAVATGTLLYGVYQQDEELSILDDTLPPVVGNGVLPPPATYVMTTPPPVEIPGIRRLKIIRPALANPAVEGSAAGAPASEVTAQQAADFYLTGTRSADLIRSPVEAGSRHSRPSRLRKPSKVPSRLTNGVSRLFKVT